MNSYRHRQSTVIGILLIIVGGLSIVFNVVDLAVGTSWRRWNPYYNIYYYTSGYYNSYDNVHYYQRESLSWISNGDTGHGFWCGVVVSIQFNFEMKDYLLKINLLPAVGVVLFVCNLLNMSVVIFCFTA